MKTINFVVSREYIQKISKINDKDINSLLYRIFIERELDYAQDFMKELTETVNLDGLARIFLGFKTSDRKYMTYILNSPYSIHGNYKELWGKKRVENLAWRYHISNYCSNLFVTDEPTGNIVQNLLENRDIKFKLIQK